VQWLDVSSAQAVAFAARRLGREPVGILAALRLEQGSRDPLGLTRIFSTPSFSRLDVGPLSVESMGTLLRERLDSSLPHTLVSHLQEASGGNPFFAIEIGRAWLRRGGVSPSVDPVPLPEDLRALLPARLGRLPRATTDALLVAAVFRRTKWRQPLDKLVRVQLCRGYPSTSFRLSTWRNLQNAQRSYRDDASPPGPAGSGVRGEEAGGGQELRGGSPRPQAAPGRRRLPGPRRGRKGDGGRTPSPST
jgi:hypothetical protein